MNKRNLLIFLAVVLLGFLVVGRFLNLDRVSKEQSKESSVKSSSVEKKIVNAEITVDTGVKISTYSATVPVGGSVLDALKVMGEKNGFNVSATSAGFIEEIDGVKNDNGSYMFWMYYVNGVLSDKGAAELKVEEGDKVLWKYGKI